MNNFRSFCRLECAKSFGTNLTSVQILFVVTNILTRRGLKSRFHTEDGKRFRVDSMVCYELRAFSEKSCPRTIKISGCTAYRWFFTFLLKKKKNFKYFLQCFRAGPLRIYKLFKRMAVEKVNCTSMFYD